MIDSERIVLPARQMLLTAVATVVFATTFDVMRGADFSASYHLLCALLTLGAACGVALICAAAPRPQLAIIAVWSALNGWLLLHPLAGIALAVLLVAIAVAAERRGRREDHWGLPLALSLGFGLVVWPQVENRLGWTFLETSAVLVSAGAFALLLVWGALRNWRFLTPSRLSLVLLIALALVPRYFAGARGEPPLVTRSDGGSPPTIILLILDTVRADHLSIHGYRRETTPNLARLLRDADNAVLYPQAHSNSTWTLPAHATLFTGLLASDHGINAQTVFGEDGEVLTTHLVASKTLAEILRESGYQTACVFANGWLEHVIGLERGFDWYIRPLGVVAARLVGEKIRRRWMPTWFIKEGAGMLSASAINRRVLRFFDVCQPGPCFVVANYMEAHAPYRPPRGHLDTFTTGERFSTAGPAVFGDSPEKLRFLEARYDEEIRALDEALGDLIDGLQERGVLDDAWLVITSDHGEAFGEHGEVEHGSTVYGEVTHIPLLVKPPLGVTFPAIREAVSLMDVTATLASVGTGRTLGKGRDLRNPGSDLVPVQIELFPNSSKSESKGGALAGRPARATIQGTTKLIEHATGFELYELSGDPREEADLAREEASIVRNLRALLPPLRVVRRPGAGDRLDLTDEDTEQLRALGYIE